MPCSNLWQKIASVVVNNIKLSALCFRACATPYASFPLFQASTSATIDAIVPGTLKIAEATNYVASPEELIQTLINRHLVVWDTDSRPAATAAAVTYLTCLRDVTVSLRWHASFHWTINSLYALVSFFSWEKLIFLSVNL